MYTEIVKIIEGGIIGDKEKVYNYAKVLAYNLEKQGDSSLSKKIRNLLDEVIAKIGENIRISRFARFQLGR